MSNSLWDALFRPHEKSKDPFLVMEDQSVWTYERFVSLVTKLAAVLERSSISPGDRIAVQTEKSVETLALYGASIMVGAVFVPLNTAYTAAEIDYFLSDAEPSVFVCQKEMASRLEMSQSHPKIKLLTLESDGSGSLAELISDETAPCEIASRLPSDIAAILYTSGTTGKPKGAMLTHDNLRSNALTLVDYWEFSADDVLLHALPIFHAHGLFVATNTILGCGGSMVFLSGFSVDNVLKRLPKATTMMGVPTFYIRLLKDRRFDQHLTAHMRLFISGSAPLLAETHRAFEARTGQRVLERYGMTETTMITSNPYRGDRIPGSVGLPLPQIDVRICDPESGQSTVAGETGVLQVAGPNVFKGYWKNPEKTNEEFTEDGFFITGDLARQRQDGYIELVGRNKDLIISGGYNVYPKEVEGIIDAVDGIEESAVVGVPHPDFGDAVIAVVVARSIEAATEDAILDLIKDQLANYKRPKRVFKVAALPRNTMGKVQKNQLRAKFSATFLI